MPKSIFFPPEIAKGSRDQQLAYLREQRAGIERVIAILENLEAVRDRQRKDSAALPRTG